MSLSLRALIVLAAAATPAIVIGPAAVAVGVVGALLLCGVMPERGACLRRFRDAVRTTVGLMVLLTFVTWLPNIAASAAPLRSFEAVVRTVVFVAAATLLWSALREDAENRAVGVLAAVACGVTVIALASLLLAPELLSLLRDGTWRVVPAALWLKQSASAMLLMLPVVLLAGGRDGGAWRPLAAAIALGLVIVIVLTESRSAVAGMVAMLLIWGVLTSLRRRHLGWTVMTALLILIAIGGVVVWLYTTRSNVPSFGIDLFAPRWLIDPHRQEIWQVAWKLAEGHRWFGIGANAVDRLAVATVSTNIPGTGIDRLPSHPHNWVIEVGVETGLVGLGALLALVATVAWRFVRDYLRGGDAAMLVVILVWTGYWSSGMFNFSFWSSWWQVSLVLITAICLAARRDAPRRRDGGKDATGGST